MTNEDQLKISPGTWVEIFQNKLQSQEGKDLLRKTKKVFIKNIQNISHLLPCKLPHKFISWL